MSWITAFGEEYDVPEKVLQLVREKRLADVSWKNDTSPSFCTKTEGAGAKLWVEHPDPLQRECSGPRFAVTTYGENGDPGDNDKCWTDDLGEALAALWEQWAFD